MKNTETKKTTEKKNEERVYDRRKFPVFGHFPLEKWMEYERDVEANWSGVRWAKAFHDHEIAKQASKEEAMWEMILQLKKEIAILSMAINEKKEEPEKEQKVKTLGGD